MQQSILKDVIFFWIYNLNYTYILNIRQHITLSNHSYHDEINEALKMPREQSSGKPFTNIAMTMQL
jgi:hypothetical protein